MMKQAFLVMLVVASVGTAHADTFELVTFTPPAGWSRLQVPRGMAYGHGEDGLLALYPSRPARGNASAEFGALWRELVEPSSSAAPPVPQVRANGGIDIAAGGRQITVGRSTAWAGLTVIVANGRVQPIVTGAGSEQASRDITTFFQTMTVGAAAATQPAQPAAPATPPAAGGGLDVDFDVPAGYTRHDDGGNVWFVAPKDPKTRRYCSFGLAPARPSSGDLATDARTAAVQMFGKIDLGSAQRGTTQAGWSYYQVRFGGVRINPNGPNEDFQGMMMAYAAVDGRVHMAFGYGNLACMFDFDPGFGDLLESVRPKGWTAKPTAPAFSLVGDWYSAGTLSMMYSFDASGHYIITYGTVTRTTTGVPEGYVRETFWQGVPMKGSYTFRNGQLLLAGHTVKIRMFEERQYDGSWKPGIGFRDPSGSETMFHKVF